MLWFITVVLVYCYLLCVPENRNKHWEKRLNTNSWLIPDSGFIEVGPLPSQINRVRNKSLVTHTCIKSNMEVSPFPSTLLGDEFWSLIVTIGEETADCFRSFWGCVQLCDQSVIGSNSSKHRNYNNNNNNNNKLY